MSGGLGGTSTIAVLFVSQMVCMCQKYDDFRPYVEDRKYSYIGHLMQICPLISNLSSELFYDQ